MAKSNFEKVNQLLDGYVIEITGYRISKENKCP